MWGRSVTDCLRARFRRPIAAGRLVEEDYLIEPAMVESLETRTLLSGDVTAVLTSAGHLRITGTNDSNQVFIGTNAGGVTTIAGMPGTGTTVNGVNVVILTLPTSGTVAGNVIINMKGGDDYVEIDDLEVQRDTRIVMGSGNDTVGCFDLRVHDDLSITTAAGDDLVAMVSTAVFDQLRITTGSGVDAVGLQHCLGIGGRATINTGSGDDGLLVAGNFSQSVKVNTGSGNDRFDVGQLKASKPVSLTMGGGDDEMRILSTADISGKLKIQGSGGTDWLGCGLVSWVLPAPKSVETVVDPYAAADLDIINDALLFAAYYVSRGGDAADLGC